MQSVEVIASENRLSKLFGFSQRKVRDYFRSARISPGMYDLELAIQIYVDNTNKNDVVTAAQKIDAETKKYKLGILKKEYHSAEEISLLVTDMIIRCKGKLNVIPARAGIELVNISNPREIEEKLKDYVNEALNELSSYDLLSMEDIEVEEEED